MIWFRPSPGLPIGTGVAFIVGLIPVGQPSHWRYCGDRKSVVKILIGPYALHSRVNFPLFRWVGQPSDEVYFVSAQGDLLGETRVTNLARMSLEILW